MLQTSAEAALYEVLAQHMMGDDLWGDRAYPVRVPVGVKRPYAVWFIAGGGPIRLRRRVEDADFTLSVKVVAEQLGQALEGQQRIANLLRDAGELDYRALPMHGEWMVKTISQDRVISLEEQIEGTLLLYHRGHQYIVQMEQR